MTAITEAGIEIDREFAAAPAAVFAAWTTAESFAQWFGGSMVQVPMETLDYVAEAGRVWTATMVLPDGNTMNWTGEFVEVDAPNRLVMTLTDQPENEARAVMTIDLAASGSGTRMRMTQETPGFSEEQRLGTIAGWESFFDVLGAIAEG